MIRISNIRWQTGAFQYTDELINIMSNRLYNLQIKYNLQHTPNNTFEFRLLKDPGSKYQRLFISNIENKTMLEAGDPKIQKLGRDFLLTKRVTKKQYDGFFNTLQGVLDDLGLMADISYTPALSKTVPLRTGKQKFPENYPQVKSFPVEK